MQSRIPTKGLPMSNSASPRNRPYFPWVSFFICATGLVAGIAFLLTREAGPSALAASDETDNSEITAGQAARIHSLTNSEQRDLPLALTNRGTVVDMSDNLIVVSHDGTEATWPLAADVEIWKNGAEIAVSDVQQGDVVDVDIQQLGTRSDGWINTAVKINVASSDPAVTSGSNKVVMPTTRVEGIVVDARDRVIVIADEQGRESTLALKPTALVMAGEETIQLAELATGDKVKLTTSKVGSRADGWTVMVELVEVLRKG